MIPVTLQPEPLDFDEKVRLPGREWLGKKGIAFDSPPPKASELPRYWSHSNKQLWESYSGVCAYLAIFFEWGPGASSTDHFVAKSRHAGNAYEWNNFRLSSLGPNRDKGPSDDVLDPVGLRPKTFVINFASGEIKPNPDLSEEHKTAAIKTIKQLNLDSPENNDMRARHYSGYLHGDCSLNFLSRISPFVYMEIERQGLICEITT